MVEPRMLFIIRQDAHGAVHEQSLSQVDRLVDEAYELGRSEAQAEARKALGRAWGAFLGTITKEMWQDIRYLAPETYAEFREAVLGVKNG